MNSILSVKINRKNILLLFFFVLTILMLVYLPASFLISQLNLNSYFLFFSIFKQLLILLLFIIALILIKNRFLKIAAFITFSLYYLFIYFLVIYKFTTLGNINPYYILDSYPELIETLTNIAGWPTFIFGCSMIIFLFFIFNFILFLLSEYADKYIKIKLLKNKMLAVIPLIILPLIIPPSQGYLSYNFHYIKELDAARKYFEPVAPDYSSFTTNSRQNIFIVQLESGNALALQGQAGFDNKQYSDNYIPQLTRISEQGIYFPYFWSQTIQTNRAMENMLCGIVNNMGYSYSYKPKHLPVKCLPQILKKSGYKTIVFRASNLEFYNMGDFLSELGFAEIHYDDIMQPDDPKWKWGYEDCIYYQRAFEYLKQNYPDPQKLFVYFEMVGHHFAWDEKENYKNIYKFNPAKNFTEKYINSAIVQDHCLAEFYRHFKEYDNSQTHIFILPDTSWPVGINGNFFNEKNAYNDNFLTFLTYLPPQAEIEKYNINKKVNQNNIYAQADLMPTIFELLNNQSYPNSFAFELLKNPPQNNYENCHILNQPYGQGNIAIVKAMDKYIYSVTKKTITYFNLKNDMLEQNPHVIAQDISFKDFKEQYFCPRYK